MRYVFALPVVKVACHDTCSLPPQIHTCSVTPLLKLSVSIQKLSVTRRFENVPSKQSVYLGDHVIILQFSLLRARNSDHGAIHGTRTC